MTQDWYLSAAQQKAAELEMELSAAKTDLLTHRHNQDLQSAGEAVQRIADLTAQQSNLQALCQGYIQSQQPRQPEVLTDSEKFARSWEKMTPQDALDLAKTSKYGKNLDFNDPHVIAGWHESQRRKARGE